jgi:hypothetical protein
MCPIHDTDSPEERWSKAEWEHYELHEKLEARARRKRRWVMASGVAVFLLLSSIPVVMDRSPQWLALKAARQLGEHFSRLKREAGTRKLALRVSADPTSPLRLIVESAPSCSSEKFEKDSQFDLLDGDPRREVLGWLDPSRGREVGIPGLVTQICFDPLKGSDATPEPSSVAGWVIAPVKELTETPERYAVVVLTGPSAEISFE